MATAAVISSNPYSLAKLKITKFANNNNNTSLIIINTYIIINNNYWFSTNSGKTGQFSQLRINEF